MTSPPCVGVLALHDSKESKAILNAVEALGHETEWLREENTVVRIDGDTLELEPSVDVVVNRLLLSNTDQPTEELGIARTVAAHRPMLNPPEATATAAHKMATASLLSREGIPVPKTLLALSGTTLNAHRHEFGPEAVYKTAIGTHGGGAWKVETDDVLTAKVGKRRAFLQELVGDRERPRDARVYVVGDRVVAAMYRYAAGEDWRTNVHLGGAVEDATESLPPEALAVAREAASVVGLDYAGVDLIESPEGWVVLEVNPTAGFRGLYRATGVSPAPHIAALALRRLGVEVDSERVADLAATLDDSPPTCMPRPDPTTFEEPPIIGLTERVVVSGTAGSETVVGKADSGAARTSIDLTLAAEIGAGPIHTVSTVRSGSARKSQSRPVVDLVVGIGGTQHTVAANIVDRSHMSHPLLIGRDVLKHYFLDISRRVENPNTHPLEDELLEEE
jgi:RimK family alpha-L-glutamate ligase